MEDPHTLPAIESIYDPLSRMRDGTLTPYSPILVKGRNLRQWPGREVRFYLSPADEPQNLIHIRAIYTHTESTVVLVLPTLTCGEYTPVMIVTDEEGHEEIFRFTDRWKVRTRRELNLPARTGNEVEEKITGK